MAYTADDLRALRSLLAPAPINAGYARVQRVPFVPGMAQPWNRPFEEVPGFGQDPPDNRWPVGSDKYGDGHPYPSDFYSPEFYTGDHARGAPATNPREVPAFQYIRGLRKTASADPGYVPLDEYGDITRAGGGFPEYGAGFNQPESSDSFGIPHDPPQADANEIGMPWGALPSRYSDPGYVPVDQRFYDPAGHVPLGWNQPSQIADASGGIPSHAASDINALADMAYREARGEGFDGMRAVAHVALNRQAAPGTRWYGKPLSSIVGGGEFAQGAVNRSTRAWQEAKAAVTAALSGQDPDPTAGATYFANPGKSDPAALRQITNAASPVAKIGNHVFYGTGSPSAQPAQAAVPLPAGGGIPPPTNIGMGSGSGISRDDIAAAMDAGVPGGPAMAAGRIVPQDWQPRGDYYPQQTPDTQIAGVEIAKPPNPSPLVPGGFDATRFNEASDAAPSLAPTNVARGAPLPAPPPNDSISPEGTGFWSAAANWANPFGSYDSPSPASTPPPSRDLMQAPSPAVAPGGFSPYPQRTDTAPDSPTRVTSLPVGPDPLSDETGDNAVLHTMRSFDTASLPPSGGITPAPEPDYAMTPQLGPSGAPGRNGTTWSYYTPPAASPSLAASSGVNRNGTTWNVASESPMDNGGGPMETKSVTTRGGRPYLSIEPAAPVSTPPASPAYGGYIPGGYSLTPAGGPPAISQGAATDPADEAYSSVPPASIVAPPAAAAAPSAALKTAVAAAAARKATAIKQAQAVADAARASVVTGAGQSFGNFGFAPAAQVNAIANYLGSAGVGHGSYLGYTPPGYTPPNYSSGSGGSIYASNPNYGASGGFADHPDSTGRETRVGSYYNSYGDRMTYTY